MPIGMEMAMEDSISGYDSMDKQEVHGHNALWMNDVPP